MIDMEELYNKLWVENRKLKAENERLKSFIEMEIKDAKCFLSFKDEDEEWETRHFVNRCEEALKGGEDNVEG